MNIDVLNMEGKKVDAVELPAEIFEAPVNVDLMHQAYVRQMANSRLGTHKTKANLEVAKRENSVILMEENFEDRYEGFDPKSPDSHILFQLYQNAFLENSLDLAARIENQFKTRAPFE